MAQNPTEPTYIQTVKMGLGDAVKRLIAVEFQFRMGTGDDKLLEERKLILEAMDRIPLEMGFDCNRDGVPDDIEIFKTAAVTSCCRLIPPETSRSRSIPKKPRVSSSRRTSAPDEVPVPIPVVEPEPTPSVLTPEVSVPPKKKKRGLLGLFGKSED